MLLESGTFLQKKVKIGNFSRKSMALDERTGPKYKEFAKIRSSHHLIVTAVFFDPSTFFEFPPQLSANHHHLFSKLTKRVTR